MAQISQRGSAAERARRRTAYRAALAVPEFRTLLAASVITITGSVVCTVALTVLVYERTSSPLLSALTFALGFLPYLFGGTLLSGIVDRVRPRALLACSCLGSAGLTGAMALPGLPVPALLALLSAASVLTSMSSGVQGGLVRAVVPHDGYVPARSLLRIAAQLAQVGGNAFGGLLLVAVTPRGAIVADSAALLAAAVVVRLGLRDRPVLGAPARSGLVRDSVLGVRQVLGAAPVRRLLLLGWLVPMFAVAPEALAAPYVTGHGGSPALVGWWLVALPVGMIAGDLLGVCCLSPRRQRKLTGPAAAASFLPYLAFLADPPIAVAWPLLVAAGLCVFYSLGLDAMLRDVVPERLFARTMAVNSAGLMTLQGCGFAAAGAMAELLGPGRAIAAAGIGGITAVLLLLPRPAGHPGRAHRVAPVQAAAGQATG